MLAKGRVGNEQLLGVVRPTEKHLESLLGCTQQKASERDHSMLNNSTTCDAVFHQNSLTNCCIVVVVVVVAIYYVGIKV